MRLAQTLLIGALIPGLCWAQAPQPPASRDPAARALVLQLERESAGGRRGARSGRLLTGDALEEGVAEMGPVRAPDRILDYADDRAVARLPAVGKWANTYIFLRRERGGRWRVEKTVNVAIAEEYLQPLRDIARLNDPHLLGLGESLRLNAQGDKALIGWFRAHRAKMDEILRAAKAEPDCAAGKAGAMEAVEALTRPLGISLVTCAQRGHYVFDIAAMPPTGGFLYAPPGEGVYAIDINLVLWVEPLGEGWYYYRRD